MTASISLIVIAAAIFSLSPLYACRFGRVAKTPGLSGKVLSKGAGVVGKVAKGVTKKLGPIATVGSFFAGVANGGTVYDESLEAVMSATGGDVARWAITENKPVKIVTQKI